MVGAFYAKIPNSRIFGAPFIYWIFLNVNIFITLTIKVFEPGGGGGGGGGAS